jgi:glycerophosphoryl diester phosphodiesterase
MDAAGAHVVVTGPQDEPRGADGLDLPEQLGEIPSTFNGYVWVDDIWNLGPALFPSVDVRSAAERKAGDVAIERRRAAG